MTDKEKLEQFAHNENVSVDYVEFNSDKLCGLYIDGCIAIKKGMCNSKTADVLAEELGHHFTTVGNIIDQQSVDNNKQERRARLWAYNKRIGLLGIINAYKEHHRTLYEMVDYLGVSEEFLLEALNCYSRIYGTGVPIGDYYIRFEPYLQVFEYFSL